MMLLSSYSTSSGESFDAMSQLCDEEQLSTPTVGQTSLSNSVAKSAAVTDAIPRAVEMFVEKKRIKISRFLEAYKNNLEANLPQLHAFACSTSGLIDDEYRERVWPILAKTLPQATRYNVNIATTTQTPPLWDGSGGGLCSAEADDDDSAGPCPQSDGVGCCAPLVNSVQQPQTLLLSDSDFESALSTFSPSISGCDEPSDEAMEETVREDEMTPQRATVRNFTLDQLRAHKEWNQVELDVARTLARFPPNIDEDERASLQNELTQLIVRILCENVDFRYYQGFHDVCLTFLLVLGTDSALQVTRDICARGAFHNYLCCSLEESALYELQDLYVLLFLHDGEVEKRLRSAELGTLFALSWPLTWFSHALQNYSQVVLFFDLFLSSHQLMPIYVSAALVSERREEILCCDVDMPSLHQLLNHIPPTVNCHRVTDVARGLLDRYPPSVIFRLREDYLRICERHKRLIAVERLQKQIEMDSIIRSSRTRRPSALLLPLLRRDNIYALAGAGAVALLSAAIVRYWPY